MRTATQVLIAATDRRVENWLEIAERGFDFAEKAAAVFADACKRNDEAVKKEIFNALSSNYIVMDRKLSISLDNLLFPVKTAAAEIRKVAEKLEPVKKPKNTRDMGKLYSKNPRLLVVSGWNRGRSSPG